MDVHNRIENITSIINAFKIEQERQLIIKSTEDFKIKTTLKSVFSDQLSKFEGNESLITKILNVECILMPNSKITKSYQKFWPQALILNRIKNRVEIGLIESYGSLWKIIPFKETNPGSRVVLETAEIGELPRYIGNNLDIVDLKADAAVWSINVFTSEFDQSKGLIVQLEHIDSNRNTSSKQLQQHRILVCEASKELSNYCELSLNYNTSSIYQHDVIEQDYPTIRTIEWEVIPESWISNDVDFLDKFMS